MTARRWNLLAPGAAPVRAALAKYDVQVVAGVLGLLCLLVFGQVGGFEFVKYDDQLYVTENPLVTQGLSWAAVKEAFLSVGYGSVWAPLLWISFQLSVTLQQGVSSAGLHLENLGHHWLAALFTYLAVARLSGDKRLAGALALLWCCHPLVAETVGWVTERKNTLSQLLFMASLWVYVRPTKANSYSIVFATVLGVAAMFVKSSAVILPIAMLLADSVLQRATWRRAANLLPLFACTLLAGMLTIVAEHSGGSLSMEGSIPLSLQALAIYVQQLAWPVDLCFYYHDYDVVAWKVWLGGAITIGLLSAAWRNRSRRPIVMFGALMTLASLALVLGYPRLVGQASHSDRYVYMPLAFGLLTLLTLLPRKALTWVSLLVVPLAIASHTQVSTWRTDDARLAQGAAVYPDLPLSVQWYVQHHTLRHGLSYVRAKIDSGSSYQVQMYCLLAVLQQEARQPEAAVTTLRELMRRQPAYSANYLTALQLAERFGLGQEAAAERDRLGQMFLP